MAWNPSLAVAEARDLVKNEVKRMMREIIEQPTTHVYAPGPDLVWLERRRCPTCQKQRWFVCWHTPRLGQDAVCVQCGDHWQDGELAPRPFERNWRPKAIASAKYFYRTWRSRLTPD